MRVIRRITAYLRGGRTQEDDGSDSTGEPSANLYHCANCETTYIGTEMETCPGCQNGVNAVPTESDLGMV